MGKAGQRTAGLSVGVEGTVMGSATSMDASIVMVDKANQDSLSGWAMLRDGVTRVDVFIDGRRVGLARYGLLREDVAERFQNLEAGDEAEQRTSVDVAHCGFVYRFSADDLRKSGREVVSVHVVCHAAGGGSCSSFPVELPTVKLPSRYSEAWAERPPTEYPSPFPLAVEELSLIHI